MNLLHRATCIALLLTSLLPSGAKAAYTPAVPAAVGRHFVDGSWQIAATVAPTTFSPPVARAAPPELPIDLRGWAVVVYTSVSEKFAQLFILTVDDSGSTLRPLTDGRANDTAARLSPDVQQVAFVSDRTGNRDIFRIKLSATGLTQLTTNRSNEIQPAWSPNSQQIVFASDRDGNWNLYVMGADGSGQTRLTDDGAADVMPTWSPDGSTIAWVRVSGDSGAIWLMNADGSNQRAISPQLRYLQHPAWSADSTRLAFDYDSNGDGFNEPAVIDAQGGNLQALPVKTTIDDKRADYAIGAWAAGDDYLLLGVVLYQLDTNPPVPKRAYAAAIPAGGGDASPLYGGGAQFEPDIRSIDHTPPVTVIKPLPNETRDASILVSCYSQDRGRNDATTFELQYRLNDSTVWQDWLTVYRQTSGDGYFPAPPGTVVSFRVRGRDLAGNREAWHGPNGNATVTFYTWRVAGTISDNRGQAVADASLDFAPKVIGATPRSQPNGNFRALLDASGEYSVTPRATGYSSPPATILQMNRDRDFGAYLFPDDNLVQNGRFETSDSPLAGWVASGNQPVSGVATPRTGAIAAQFGTPCSEPCLTAAEIVPTTPSGNTVPVLLSLALDAEQSTYLVTMIVDNTTFFSGPRLYLYQRTAAGTWLPAELLGNGSGAKLVVDSKQILHIIWVTKENQLLYQQRPLNGTWSAPVLLGTTVKPELVVDQAGNAYIFSLCGNMQLCENGAAGRYDLRLTDGTWQAPRSTPGLVTSAAARPDAGLQVVWSQRSTDGRMQVGYTATIQPNGNMSTPRSFGTIEVNNTAPQIALDTAGRAQIAWTLNDTLYINEELEDGTFSLSLPQVFGGNPQIIQAGGALYIASRSENSTTNGSYFRTRRASGEWSAPILLDRVAFSTPLLAVNAAGHLVLVRESAPASSGLQIVYQEHVTNPTAGAATITQRLAIPGQMNRPTLAFDHLLTGGSRLVATVTADGQAEEVANVAVSSNWTHSAIDMQQWAGQTVDITLSLEQAAGAPVAYALVDDVSLGSWLTPVVTAISAAQVDAQQESTITISGDNFIATPTVSLGGVALPNVEWLSATSLQVTIPTSIPPGAYPLAVANPGGQRAIGPTLLIGYQSFLPFSQR